MLQTGNPRTSRVEGFTLLELLVVLAILGVLLGIFSLGTGSILSSGDLRLAAREILSEVASARGRAAGSRSEQVLVFNLDENRLEREIKEKGGESVSFRHGKKTVLTMPRGVVLVDIRVENRGKFQEGKAAVHFFPNGCLERMLIHLKNLKESAYTIEINAVTGQATLYEGYVDQEEEM